MRKFRNMILCTLIGLMVLGLTACGGEKETDPGAWGYDCKVVFDTLGGVINSREVRTTYYMNNSYVYEPSGSSGMLIAPEKDGYLLAGWYTAKEDILDESGKVIGYNFKGEDRWDFSIDRVQEDMTLYARWIEQGKVTYLNAADDTVLFEKNITADSTVKELSDAVMVLIKPAGTTFAGYFSDKACTQKYVFTDYVHTELQFSDKEMYTQLQAEFPEAIAAYENTDEEAITGEYAFLKKIGFDIVTTDETVLAAIRERKNEIYEENLKHYTENTAGKTVYMKFTEGNEVTVTSIEDLKQGSQYVLGASGVDRYIIAADLDFEGAKLTIGGDFTGKIEGNGHTISNIELTITSTKKEKPGDKLAGLCKSMDGAVISNLNFDQITITASAKKGVNLYVGLLAGEAKDTTVTGCAFSNISITVSEADDGMGSITLGDLFGKQENCTITDCTAENVAIEAEETNLLLQ